MDKHVTEVDRSNTFIGAKKESQLTESKSAKDKQKNEKSCCDLMNVGTVH